MDLESHVFPVPVRSNHSYKNTWGAARGWGGRRIHEGTDIFASYGVPVRATSYGIIEMKGWNRYGGWRVGIRDINNNYHYFAHLNGFSKDIHTGQVVEPGQLIGSVGSSGYGPLEQLENSLHTSITECIKIMAKPNGPMIHTHI